MTTVGIITPYPKQANNGNWHTAARWARMLSPRFDVRVLQQWDHEPYDLLIALHARRSAASIAAFAAAHPKRPLWVVLTGTDLYHDIERDADAQRSLELATQLIVLNELGTQALPKHLREKTALVLQSAAPLAAGRRPVRTFDIAVVGHLRDEKDPLTAMRSAMLLPPDSRVRMRHVGAPLDPELARAARAAQRTTSRYHWLGALPRARARQLMRNAHLLLHPSKIEGGAHVIAEAVQAGTPVIASDCDGNIGMLGRDYPGFFPTGNADAAATLIHKAETHARFYRALSRTCRQRAALFDPQREQRRLRSLVHNALDITRTRSR